MSDTEHPDVIPTADQPAVPRGHPWIAWGVVVAIAAWIALQRTDVDIAAKKQAIHQRLQTVVVDWQTRYLVGLAKLFPQNEQEALLSAAPVDRGPIEQRLRNVVLVGEMQGPKAAAEKLKKLDAPLQQKAVDQEDRDAADTLARLYGDLVEGKAALPSIGPADREKLVERLGWSGRLALHPADSTDAQERGRLLGEAQQTIFLSLAVFALAAVVILAGVAVLAAIVLLLLLRPQSRALPPSTQHGGIYAETFAVWIASFVGLSYLAHLLPVAERYRFLLSGAITLVSLAALGWPAMRGVPWRTVRQEIGLHLGRKPLVELLLGSVTYLAAIALAIGGQLIVVALLALAHRLQNAEGGDLNLDRMAYHPIEEWLLKGDWWAKLQVVLLASVLAPLAEETLFRGVLYRQLRDATSRLGYVASGLASALATSLVFAAIHPQGLIAVPALMGLALGFTLAREWRGTLLPAMIAHGLNNGLVTCVLIWMTSG